MNKRKKPYGLWEHVEDLLKPFPLLALHASYSHYVPALFPYMIVIWKFSSTSNTGLLKEDYSYT